MVELAAGDMIPADVRLLSCKDLFLIQGSLTGESYPVEKFAAREDAAGRSPALPRTINALSQGLGQKKKAVRRASPAQVRG